MYFQKWNVGRWWTKFWRIPCKPSVSYLLNSFYSDWISFSKSDGNCRKKIAKQTHSRLSTESVMVRFFFSISTSFQNISRWFFFLFLLWIRSYLRSHLYLWVFFLLLVRMLYLVCTVISPTTDSHWIYLYNV